MSKTMNLNVRLGGSLKDYVANSIGESGDYDNASEFVRDLIRRDKAETEQKRFELLKAELQKAFAAPDNTYIETTAEEIIARNTNSSSV